MAVPLADNAAGRSVRGAAIASEAVTAIAEASPARVRKVKGFIDGSLLMRRV